MLDDGSELPQRGRLMFADLSVDPTSAQVTLRTEVANPQAPLLPGMYVRTRLVQGQIAGAMLVPQQAVTPVRRPTVSNAASRSRSSVCARSDQRARTLGLARCVNRPAGRPSRPGEDHERDQDFKQREAGFAVSAPRSGRIAAS